MKTIKQVTIKPVFVDVIPDFYVQDEVYISMKYKVSKHLCLCGCGEMTIMPFDLIPNQWWTIVENGDLISFIGSVGNFRFPCKSHYIITNNVANFV